MSDREAAARAMLNACETTGLFFATGHGIPSAQRRCAFNNAKHFFSLAEEIKRPIVASKAGFARGYIGFGRESGSHRLECKEGFSYGYPWRESDPPENMLQGANVWPEAKHVGLGWRQDMEDLFRSMVSVSTAVTRGLSLALGLEEGKDFQTLCCSGDTISLMRLFHYLPYDEGGDGDGDGDDDSHENEVTAHSARSPEESPRKTWSSPHTDWGFSTCILQDTVGGLQFLDQRTQRWVDVSASSEDALVINCGDYLSLVTKGRLKSPVHQVVSKGGEERISFVFFYYPSFDAPLPEGKRGGQAMQDAQESQDTDAARHAMTGDNHSGGDEAQQVDYNTLLDLRRDGDEGVCFGQYLERKWSGVARD